jgi:uncharacterized protein
MSQPESEPTDTPFDPIPVLAAELNLPRASVSAVVQLLAESSTVPFIARYRKEATGGLDEVQIRNIEERRTYLVEMEARRKSILNEIKSQGKLTPELRSSWRPQGPKPSSKISTCRSSPSGARAPRSPKSVGSSRSPI